MLASVQLEDSPDVVEALDQAVDLLAGVVDGEAGPGGRGDAEAVHEQLGAVVAGADRDAVAVEDLGDVVGVDALELEGDGADAVGAARRAEDAQAGDLGEALQRVVGDLALVGVRPRRCRAPSSQRRRAARPIACGDRRRPRLEAGRRVGVGGAAPW